MREPIRLQLSRTKGFKLQAISLAANGRDAVIVARPSRWGNPFVIGRDGSQADCVARYRTWLQAPAQRTLRSDAKQLLQGRNLACWCKAGSPCHADSLLALVNG